MALAARVTLRGLLSPVQCLRCRVAVALPLTRALSGAAAGAGAAPESALAKETRDAQAMAASSFDPSLINGAETPLKINALADSIVALNLVETMQLGEALKKRLGLPAGPMMLAPLGSMVPGAAGGGGAPAPGAAAGAPAAAGGADAPAAGAAAAAPAAAAKEEKSTVDLRLVSFKPESKIKVIKEVRAVTSLGLKEAKELVESAPCVILANVKRPEAAKILEKLKTDTGAELELV